MLKSNRIRRTVTIILMEALGYQVLAPYRAHALSSGPVQPEIQSFEPVGTTDMVDPFTGDFVYNIPLLDVEGYPINISYHSGVTMEQEASWVGLGWNINPGAVNRSVRGLPDDFAGDTIEKQLYLRPDVTTKFGLSAGGEILGAGDPVISASLSLGATVSISNYRGVGVDFYTSGGVNTSFGMVNAGLNIGASAGSQSGGSINYGASAGLGITRSLNDDMSASGSFNANMGGVYSPRSGHRRNAGFDIGVSMREAGARQSTGFSTGTSVPIGMQNYTAVVSNASYMNSVSGRLKIGGELFGGYGNVNVHGSKTTVGFEQNGSRAGYGYFHLEDADSGQHKGILDFSREKDGSFNSTMHYLPQATLTYDVYSVSGQGTGGSFRPFRNDIGSVYDPYTASANSDLSVEVEVGLGNAFEAGLELNTTNTKMESGPFSDYTRPFLPRDKFASGENYYFKEAGEVSLNNTQFLGELGNSKALTPDQVNNKPIKILGADARVPRANLISGLTALDDDTAALVGDRVLTSLDDTAGFREYPTVAKTTIGRAGTDLSKKLRRRPGHLTEIVQTQKDGRRYVYGLPVVNNVQREVSFAIGHSYIPDKRSGLVNYTKGSDDAPNNGNGIDYFYSSTVTPTYVTAHLLTGVLSSDYTDVTGDGISDDDIGSYTRFNYSRKDADYRWRSPIQEDSAQYIPGYSSDKLDDKASYIVGSREQWMLHSVETKNYVAEFFVSKRLDARGVTSKILTGSVYNEAPYDSLTTAGYSYKLDSIVLYNKHDRFQHNAAAVPLKTVIFRYDYSLCRGLPNNFNSLDSLSGKLTLKAIYVRHGTSNIGMISPYRFEYSSLNPRYNTGNKDRWGNYKPSQDPELTNFDFPFTDQTDSADLYASAWSLEKIKLPSGGIIEVTYESDDYAYVQDKPAMEMFRLTGFGNSANFQPGNQLYFQPKQPNLFLYFTRRTASENAGVPFGENYFKEYQYLYYNIPVELSPSKYEGVKGYAEVKSTGACTDGIHGYIELQPQALEGVSGGVSPISYTALNLGRYSLPHILFPGQDPDASSLTNIAAGLKKAIEEIIFFWKNPIYEMLNKGKAKKCKPTLGFMRLTSPGQRKKGGGHRVKQLVFSDNWDAMVGGDATAATYGKVYDYTIRKENRKGSISSGVASYEPSIGGDEIPQRLPVHYDAQAGSNFPPNDPVELYQEEPIGESFFPAPVVGYSQVTVRSINQGKAKSAQGEDVYGFYTAKDFPVRVTSTPLQSKPNAGKPKVTWEGITLSNWARQGFMVTLNDMHGKPRNTEHYVLKPDTATKARELINYQRYEYKLDSGRISNSVPVYGYGAVAGSMAMTYSEIGRDVDITMDTRMRREESKSEMGSVNFNSFFIGIVPIALPIFFPWGITNKSTFEAATVTKIVQQYGIIDKIVNRNEGAITEVRNEVFDPLTGSAMVTSVNNEFGDREYTANYPAYWANKEYGPAYGNHGVRGVFDTAWIETMGSTDSIAFRNYPPGYSDEYKLRANTPVAKIPVDDQIVKFFLGDELLLYPDGLSSQPVRTWMMGYFSNTNHCYIVVAPRSPHALDGLGWQGYAGQKLAVPYRIVRSGKRNRLTETVQSFVTADKSNVLPNLKNNLTNLIGLQASVNRHALTLYAPANTGNDSMNPFVTGKVGIYRPQQQLVNLKARDYASTGLRKSGLFNSPSYWTLLAHENNDPCYPDYEVDSPQFGFNGYLLNTQILKSMVGHEAGYSADNWTATQQVTSYNPAGQEIENYETGIGYNAAIYGCNHQLPVAVARNARHGDVICESFDDFVPLQTAIANAAIRAYLQIYHSPFARLFTTMTAIGGSSQFSTIDAAPSGAAYSLSDVAAHTGIRSLKVTSNYDLSLPLAKTAGTLQGWKANHSFSLDTGRRYLVSFWAKPTGSVNGLAYTYTNGSVLMKTAGPQSNVAFCVPKSGIIDGWQQYEAVFSVAGNATAMHLQLAGGYYYDDLRMYPWDANCKGFVYDPVTRRLMATLDENNYATLYEYDAEGNLVRTKKETERGVLTLNESRRAHPGAR